MNTSIRESVYENKFRLDGVEFPFHCILIDKKKTPKTSICPHYHEYIEILYNLEGDCDVYINGRICVFRTGDLLIINSGESHDLLFERSCTRYIVIKVLPEILYSSGQSVFEMKYTMPFLIENSENKRYFTKEEQSTAFIHDTVSGIMQEWNRRDYGFELSIRSDILKIFLWVLRYWRDHNLDSLAQFDHPDELLRTIQKALEYISQNYSRLTTSSVAQHCGLSYSYFSRVFKKVMHLSFSEYLNRYRIAKSEQLLCSTDMPISDVALAVGFSEASYFIRKFKEERNISPRQFRAKQTKTK